MAKESAATPEQHLGSRPAAAPVERATPPSSLSQRFAPLGLAWLDWSIPLAHKLESSGDELRRARLTISVGLFAGLAVLGTLVAATKTPDSEIIRFASVTLALLLVATPVLVKQDVPILWIQNGMIGMMYAYAMMLVGLTGGADTGGIIVAILAPLFSILLCGTRAGLIWAGITCISLAVIGIAVGRGFDAPVDPNQAEVALWSLWAGIAGIFATAGVAFTYEWLHASTLRDLVESRSHADQEHVRRLELEAKFRIELEKLVEERTQELSESREHLRRADRLASIGTLAAGVAHQINNPVGSILVGSELALLLAKGADSEREYRKALASNVVDAKRCGEIVRNLLRFSRNGVTDRAVFDLNEAASKAIATLRGDQDRFDLRLAHTPVPVYANAIEIEQVILNLLSNALQSGTSRVELQTRTVGRKAVIQVSDEGQGIKEEDQCRLFDPFFTTRIGEGGTGLGLSIVHGIVNEHGGMIEVESEVGAGTRFSISLPLDDSP